MTLCINCVRNINGKCNINIPGYPNRTLCVSHLTMTKNNVALLNPPIKVEEKKVVTPPPKPEIHEIYSSVTPTRLIRYCKLPN